MFVVSATFPLNVQPLMMTCGLKLVSERSHQMAPPAEAWLPTKTELMIRHEIAFVRGAKLDDVGMIRNAPPKEAWFSVNRQLLTCAEEEAKITAALMP